jgi:hypothetical protein
MHRSIRLHTRRPTTSARVLLFLVEVFRPILLLIGFVLRLIYQVLFSWWLNPTFDNWIRNGFLRDIKEGIPTLFDLHGAKVISDPKPETNDSNMDYLCVASRSLIFKFCRWRRENYEVQLAATHASTEFFDLLDALHPHGKHKTRHAGRQLACLGTVAGTSISSTRTGIQCGALPRH